MGTLTKRQIGVAAFLWLNAFNQGGFVFNAIKKERLTMKLSNGANEERKESDDEGLLWHVGGLTI